MTHVPDILDVIAGQRDGKTAFVHGQRVVSYGQLRGRVAALSARLSDGFALIVVKDSIECAIAWLACYHRGVSCAIFAPDTYGAERQFLDEAIPYCQLITDSRLFGRSGSHLVRIDAGDELGSWGAPSKARFDRDLIFGTSRSSGRLKLVRHKNSVLALHRRFWEESFPLVDGDIVLCPPNIPFGYGFIVSMTWAIWAGKTVNFPAEGTKGELFAHSAATVSALAVPQLMKVFLPKMRLAVSSGAMVAKDDWSWFRQTYPGVKLCNLVGATENLTPFLYSEDETCFRIFPHYEARVCDSAQQPVVGQPGLFEFKGFFEPGYWNSPELDARINVGGWVRLGDFAIDGGDGTFKFLGKNTISFDVENAVRADSRVRDCYLCMYEGAPVLLVESDSITNRDVQAVIRPMGIMIPDERLIVVQSLGRTAAGKVLSTRVAELMRGNQIKVLVEHEAQG